MSSTPRTDEAAGYPTHEWEACAERLFECSQKLEIENESLRKSAEVSAALIAEHVNSFKQIKEHIINGSIHALDCIKEECAAALAKTPESVGADLAKKDQRIAQLEEMLGSEKRLLSHAKDELTSLQKRIEGLISTNGIAGGQLEASADDCLREHERANNAESQRDALILLIRRVVPMLQDQYDDCHGAEGEHAGEEHADVLRLGDIIRECDLAVKQSGNQPEVSASSADGDTRWRQERGVSVLLERKCKEYHNRVESLEKEIGEVREDKARLDWMERVDQHGLNPHYDEADPSVGVFPVWSFDKFIGRASEPLWEMVVYADSLRSAIDAARKPGGLNP